MIRPALLAAAACAAAVAVAAAEGQRPPRLLSETGLYAAGTLTVDRRNRPFSPQYPLWSDGARKSRWVRLPPGAAIDARDLEAWDFPAGTRFWKEFAFDGRKVETRMLSRSGASGWTFASYRWNDAQTDAELVPAEGWRRAAEVAPRRFHDIPSIEDCRACHDSARTEILGFSALQLSTDRDPLAPHAEPLAPGMVTLATLVAEQLVKPARPELVTAPPRIAGDERTRAVLGYLSANCGSCHNEAGSLAPLGLFLKAGVGSAAAAHPAAVQRLLRPTAKWHVPEAPEGTSAFVTPGAPELSALLIRMKSRRPSSQMPPLGTVLPDREAIALVERWIRDWSADAPR